MSDLKAYNDFLIPMGFPNWKIYLPDQWYKPILQFLGYNKDGLTSLGHSLIVMVDGKTGEVVYTDFGRYCVSPTMGRARLYPEDPSLKVDVKAEIKNGEIKNIHEIVDWVYKVFNIHMSGGPLIYKVLANANFNRSHALAKEFCNRGFIHYNILGKKNSNCSRYVRSIILEGLQKDKIDFGYRYGIPTPTPVDNVFFQYQEKGYMVYEHGEHTHVKHKFLDHIRFYNGKRKVGYYDKVYKEYPDKQWLNCEGIGAYFRQEIKDSHTICLHKFDFMNNHEWSRDFEDKEGRLDDLKSYELLIGDSLYDFKLKSGDEIIKVHRKLKELCK